MKRLTGLILFVLTGGLVFTYSCNEDDPVYTVPSVAAPAGVTAVEFGATGQSVTFNVSVDPNLTATYSATGVGVIITSGSGNVSASSVTVNFDAGQNAGAAGITLEVTDSENSKDNATAVISILPPGDAPTTFNKNGNIPTTANLVVGQTLEVSGVDVASDDGVKQVTVTVNGTGVLALDSVYSGSPTSAEYGFSVNTADLGEGSYVVVFTAEDANGSTASFSHALTVEPLGFDIVVETGDQGNIVSREVSGSINSDFTFTNDAVWILGGRVKVVKGAALTIDPGSVLKGRSGTGSNATALLIARGSTILAEGSAQAPIIMTSISDNITVEQIAQGDFTSPNLAPTVNGLWGGLIVLGSAPISATNDNDEDVSEVQIEGIPTSDQDGLYGGSDKTDNSGIIRYVSIRHGGSNIGAGNEINGLTLGGVGSTTVIENVEVVANQDDGIEWFGGTVSVVGAFVWNCGDDGLDTDQAWNGTCSNFVIITPQGGSAFELDGPEGSYKDGNHTLTNGTVYAGAAIDALVDFDEGTNVDMSNIYFYGISTGTAVEEYKAMSEAGNGSVTNFEYSNVADPPATFLDIPAGQLNEVPTNQNTVGPKDDTGFEWTWGSQSGTLGSIGS